MLSIQDVGKQILSKNPLKFYVFLGEEYGIKEKYIQILRDHYGDKLEATSVADLLTMMHTKHIIPLSPKLYVVRYDEEFISNLSSNTKSVIDSTNIIGTIVCIYQQPKHANKVTKYLSDYAVSIDAVSQQFIKKYLHSDYPTLPDRFIDLAVSMCDNYSQAQNVCKCMSAASLTDLYALSDMQIVKLFGCSSSSTDAQIKLGVASRNFSYLLQLIEAYPDSADRILYTILSTMIELDKILDNSYVQSELKVYSKRWTRQDIYYMFMNTYEELQKLRSMSSYNATDSLIYLISLLNFPSIPDPEVLV